MSWLTQMRAPSLAIHPGGAPGVQRPAQPFPGHSALRESTGALDICLGCHIQLSAAQWHSLIQNGHRYPECRLAFLRTKILSSLDFPLLPTSNW